MAEVYLITGGARSGKSSYAEKIAIQTQAEKVYIATAPVLDDEMRVRVIKHQQIRSGKNWQTIEEQFDIATVIAKCQANCTVLVECLTLWINNLLYRAEQHQVLLTESDIVAECDKLRQACEQHQGKVIFVLNEVGLGIVPENKRARLFRDLSGRCGQEIAKFADHVTLVNCGLPLQFK